uniref:RanBP-type and C3HC4-type zinc finger-containing protein 1 n=1 Tax=Albugo laibachii Nc14 TaxID=890382 RepID=F0WAJ9_9STRA|nr:E3 ubiquitin ligase putative [Albugo laibachii Nc14]|eukprot:CCA18170.1 E3 ubiquitin ligase putative [Albugo laibachii Nc14]
MEDEGEWQWPHRLRELRAMESTIRCSICGDYLHGPVLLPCSHIFCSECVRRYLQVKGSNGCCPQCKASCEAIDFRPIPLLERLVIEFASLKPKLLGLLAPLNIHDPETVDSNRSNHESRVEYDRLPAKERFPLVSYSVMKDKEVRKLLETIGITESVKDREEVIQIHKEFVLLSNAQADSCNPKSTDTIRSEVLQRFRLRQQEKRKADGKRQFPVMCDETLERNFKKLKQQIEDQRDRKVPMRGPSTASQHEWRHICPVGSSRDFYIHSRTCEIRLEPPEREVIVSLSNDISVGTDSSRDEEKPSELDVQAERDSREDEKEDEVVCVDGSWNCQRCTLLNQALRTICEACGVERTPRSGNSSAKKKRYQSKILM